MNSPLGTKFIFAIRPNRQKPEKLMVIITICFQSLHSGSMIELHFSGVILVLSTEF